MAGRSAPNPRFQIESCFQALARGPTFMKRLDQGQIAASLFEMSLALGASADLCAAQPSSDASISTIFALSAPATTFY